MFRIIKRKNLNKAIRVKYVWLISDRINQCKRKGNNHMCLYSAKKKRETTMLVKTIVLTISYKEEKKREEKKEKI